MYQRILVLGQTGVDKKSVCHRITDKAAEFGHNFQSIDFERDFVARRTNFYNFLNQDIAEASDIWRQSWHDFCEHQKSDANKNKPVMLCMHACYVTSYLGPRSVFDITRICRDFAPDLVITLTDDIYNLGHKSSSNKLSPTLEQLVMARRIEAMIGDNVRAAMHEKSVSIPHIFLSANHPVETLSNIILFHATPTYLSFPISEPRRNLKNGDSEFVDCINSFHVQAAQTMRRERNKSFVSPLAIDELPFVNSYRASRNKKGSFIFRTNESRWDLKALWGSDAMMLGQPVEVTEFLKAEVDGVLGTIESDVGWRDRRLALQSDSISVFCPVPKTRDEVTRGVRVEIDAAASRSIPIRIWQNPEWDPKEIVVKYYGRPGSMGGSPSENMTTLVATQGELLSF